jgi:acetolactate synthase regulatory subunit
MSVVPISGSQSGVMSGSTEGDYQDSATRTVSHNHDHVAATDASEHGLPIRFDILMTGAEGCGVRVLGLIVRRGWYLQAAELLPGFPGETRRMTVDVLRRDETRRLETLKSQIDRLHDVIDVDYFDPAEEGERNG